MIDDKLKPEPKNKIYSPFAILLVTFFGGPLLAGYLISENFKLLGEPAKARLTWLHTVLALILLSMAFYEIPDLKGLLFFLPIIYSVLALYLVQLYQGEKIKAHIENKGQFYPFWRAIFVVIIFWLIMFILISFLLGLSGGKEAFQKLYK